jgi:hypothetical protein
MGAILLVARAEARRRWAGLLGLAVIVALVGAVSMAAIAGARRSSTALDRYLAVTESRDGQAFAFAPGQDVGDQLTEAMRDLEGVAQVGSLRMYATDANFDVDFTLLAPVDDVAFQQMDRPRLVQGRAPHPDAPDEIIVSEAAVDQMGVETGDVIETRTFGARDCEALGGREFLGFNGPELRLEVVGVARLIEDLQGNVIESSPTGITSPAFAERYGGEACAVAALAGLRYEAGGGPTAAAVEEAASAVGAEEMEAGDIDDALSDARAAIDVVVVGLTVFAAVAVVAGVLAVGQAVSRQAAAALEADAAVEAVGLTRNQRAVTAALPVVGAGAVGALLGGAGAMALSPLFPIGVARRAEPSTGVDLDGLVLGVGAAVLAVLVAAVAVALARRRLGATSSEPVRGSSVAGAAARAGAGPTVVVGLRLAYERRGGRGPVRTALVGAIVAIAGAAGVLVMATSVDEVVADPARWGWLGSSQPDIESEDPEATVQALQDDPDISAVGIVTDSPVRFDDERTVAHSLDVLSGSMSYSVLEGRVPSAAGEVAFAANVLEDVDVGETVRVRREAGSLDLTLVGRVVIPPEDVQPGDGAVVTPETLRRLAGGVPEERRVILAYRPGAERAEVESRLEREHQLSFPAYARPIAPGRLAYLNDISGLMAALGGFFALLGLVGLAHALAVSARRQRGLFATLRSMGFRRSQVRRSVVLESLALVAASAAVGIPLGIVIGRTAWSAAVGDLGMIDTPTTPVLLLFGVVGVALLVGLAVAAIPAWSAARGRPAQVLRTE